VLSAKLLRVIFQYTFMYVDHADYILKICYLLGATAEALYERISVQNWRFRSNRRGRSPPIIFARI